MSTINQQEEVNEGSKDDDNNTVAVPSNGNEDNNCGDSNMTDQNEKNPIIAADITPKSPEETHVGQTETPSKDESEQQITAAVTDSSAVMEDINVQPENVAGKNSADTHIEMSANTAAFKEPVDSPLTPLIPAENETSLKETSMHDISESEFELKWSDGEDEAPTPLNDEALKKLDEELGIDDKIKENDGAASQDTLINVPEKSMDFEISKECGDHNIKEKDIEMTVDEAPNKGTNIPEPNCLTETSVSIDTNKVVLESNSESINSEEKSMSESDIIVKESGSHGEEMIERAPIEASKSSCELENASKPAEPTQVSEADETVCVPISSNVKEDNMESPSQIPVPESNLIEEQQASKILNTLNESEVSKDLIDPGKIQEKNDSQLCDKDAIKQCDSEVSACDMETEQSMEIVQDQTNLASGESILTTEIVNKNVEKSEIQCIALNDKSSKTDESKVQMETNDVNKTIKASSENTDIDNKLDVKNDSIKINTEHRINRPDVMLDIPTQEFDIDDFEDTSEKQELTHKLNKEDSDLTTKTVTEIVNQLFKESKDYSSTLEITDNKVDIEVTSDQDLSQNKSEIMMSEDAKMTPIEKKLESTEKNLEETDNPDPDPVETKEKSSIDASEKSNEYTLMDVSQIETKNQENITEIKEQTQIADSVSNVSKEVDELVDEKVQTAESQETNIDNEKDKTAEEAVLVSEPIDQTGTAQEKQDKNTDISIINTEKEATEVKPSTSKADQLSTLSSDLAICNKDKPDPTEPAKPTDTTAVEEPEVADSLGLLAESSRVMDEEEEEPEQEEDADDGEGDDDDEDFDPDCEESSNQTGEHSEESNSPHSEVDIQEEGIDIEFNNEADKIDLDGADTAFDSVLGESSDVLEAETVTQTSSTEVSQDAQFEQVPVLKVAVCVNEAPPDCSKKAAESGRRAGSLLADLLTKPRADMNLPEGTVRVDPSNMGVVDLEASSSDDDSQAKNRRQTITVMQIAKQVEEATKPTAANNKADKEQPKDNKSKTSEILNLDSDEDVSDKKEVSFIEKPKEGNQCINYDCTSADTVPYYLADRMTIAYYGAARRRRRPVCQNCRNVVQSRNEGLVAGIKDLRPLLALRMARPKHTLLEISDSDSEGEDEPLGEDHAKYLEDELTDMLNDVWRKYKLDERLKETEAFLETELDKMQKDSLEVDRLLSECQSATDALRTELYAGFEGPRRHLPAISIHDTNIASYSCLEAEEEPLNEGPRYSKRRSSASLESLEAPAKKAALPTDDKRTTRSMYDAQPKPDDDRDVSVVRLSAEAAPADLPPAGEPTKPPLRVGALVYAMKNQYGAWLKGKVLDVQPKTEHQYTMCRVRFEHKVKNPCKQLSARSLAYTEPSDVRMTIGTRVIALFKNSDNSNKRGEFYYSGVVAEIPNPVNRYRYLVFFDDGYAQYVEHKHTRLVYESKALVWEEVHPFSRDFVCNYLMKYPERPMVRLHAGQSVTVEWNGKWWETVVLCVDAALVQVRFPDARTEWIYRGSTRLQPLFSELQAARRTDRARLPRSTKPNVKTNVPYVEYIRSEDQTKPDSNYGEDLRRQRSVAKKSTSIAQQITTAATDGVISRVVFYTPKNSVRPLKMLPHKCGPHCKRKDLLSLAELQTYNPLTKPLLSGWERQIVKYKHSKSVMYRAPCGRRLRNLPELHDYLRAIHSDMAVDLFDYSPATHCLAEFVLSKTNVQKKDLSHGKENIPVPCVNYYDHSLPEFCSYNTERTPTAGVPLNLDTDFLCGCDCDDDCVDKSKCACWKMTLEGARTIGIESTDVGYQYRRLPEPLPSGIYECNSRCKCKATCLNRVVQNPLQLKLQVFKTLNRGWGIRALNDVPKGAFICIYAGNLLTDATANLDGLNEGDEYLAELDYIEVVEAMKEGYEDDVPEADQLLDKKETKKSSSEPESESTESEEEETKDKNDIEDGDFQPGYKALGLTEFNKRLRRREKKKEKEDKKEKQAADDKADKREDDECITISDDEEVRTSLREPSRLAAEESMTDNKVTSKYRSIRSYFGKDEACYIMDAKVQGNIGRYLNHSCSPNVFVQNVFVDTHDPRFPWVSFFALHHIRAGTELTWNYNYDIGSVPGKVLYCYCGATNCRGRLL